MKSTLHGFLADESAATAIEYGLIVALISLAIITLGDGHGSDAEYGLFYDFNTDQIDGRKHANHAFASREHLEGAFRLSNANANPAENEGGEGRPING